MKKKINIRYKLLACILIFSAGTITAQTGFFTPNPVHPLQIDAAKDNGTTPDATKLSNDVIMTSDGKLGVGLLNPVTKVDVRSPDNKGLIGVGTNTQTPAAAGAGAIRYNGGGFLDYSDGEQWIALPLTAPTKALVNAYIDTGVSVPSGTSTIIKGWKEAFDAGNDFDTTNSIFTAPRDGFYLVSFSVTLTSNSIARNSYIETAIESVLGSSVTGMATTIPKFITVNSYPAYQATIVSNFISGNCNAIFQLKAGNQIQFSVKQTTGSARNTVSDRTLNNFSISEL
jgi:hypothetical protein